jgi:hypothetical protein
MSDVCSWPIATRRLGMAERRFRRKAEMALFTAMRRFPPPWTIDEANNACFIVRDNTGQALAYFYLEDEPGRRSAAKLLTGDEARRMVANCAKLQELAAAPGSNGDTVGGQDREPGWIGSIKAAPSGPLARPNI